MADGDTRVVATDLATGESEECVIPANDYVLIAGADCEIHTTAHLNGTHVITVKRPRRTSTEEATDGR